MTYNKELSKITYGTAGEETKIKDISGELCTTNFILETPIDSFKVYDAFSNSVTAEVENSVGDSTAPTNINITRPSQTEAIVSARDSQSGLWKIEQYNSSDTRVGNISEYTNYPASSSEDTSLTITVDANATTLRVFDAVGNATNYIDIPSYDQIPPNIDRLTRTETQLIVRATDDVS